MNQSVSSNDEARQGLRERRVLGTRRRILDAARSLFDEEGFARVGLEEVAARAEVVRPTIYRHFGSKLGLLEALVSDADERAGIDRVLTTMRRPDAAEAIEAMLDELCRFWAAEAVVFRQVIGLAAVDADARAVIEGRDASRRRDLARLVDRLARQKRLRRGWSKARATDTLWLLTSFTTFDHLSRRSGMTSVEVRRTLGELAGGFTAPPRAPARRRRAPSSRRGGR